MSATGRTRRIPSGSGGARLALNLVVNYEEGAEYGPLEGDGFAESILSDIAPSPPLPGLRNRNIESLYEYGRRVGIWRVLRLFKQRGIAPTMYLVGRALELNPAVAEAGCDTVCHGWRWVDYLEMDEAQEREHIARTVRGRSSG